MEWRIIIPRGVLFFYFLRNCIGKASYPFAHHIAGTSGSCLFASCSFELCISSSSSMHRHHHHWSLRFASSIINGVEYFSYNTIHRLGILSNFSDGFLPFPRPFFSISFLSAPSHSLHGQSILSWAARCLLSSSPSEGNAPFSFLFSFSVLFSPSSSISSLGGKLIRD